MEEAFQAETRSVTFSYCHETLDLLDELSASTAGQ